MTILEGLTCGNAGCACNLSARRGKGLTHCPNHADPTPSLNVEEKDGVTLVKCHAGCEQSAVIQALRDKKLWADHTTWLARREVARFSYVNRDGTPNRTVLKYEPKAFSQRGPNGEGSLEGVPSVLYHLPDVIDAVADGDLVVICEGEKDSDALRAIGICATTSPQGAGKWQDSFVQDLINANIAIISDRDEPGRKHAREIATSCGLAAKSVKVIELPSHDASDWLAAGGTKDQLLALIAKAPPWDADGRRILTGKDVVSMYADVIAKRMSGDPDHIAIPTGLGALDKYIGYRVGDLILVVAATGIGKSSLLTTMQLDLDRRGIASLYISLEMSWLAMVDRMLASGTALSTLGERPGLLVDEPSLTVGRLEMLCRVARLRGCRVVYVDYAQRIVGDKQDSEYERVSVISNELARIARETRVCIVAAAQVSRQGASGKGTPPNLEDIRGSGHLEQDAAVVLSLGRKMGDGDTKVAIQKNRWGGTGYVTLDFDARRASFTSWVKPSEPSGPAEQEEPVPWLPD